MENCIFCKIVRKEIPANLVAEDAQALAFMDIHPARKGHVLVVPKHHAPSILDVPQEDLCHAMKLVQRVALAIKDAIHPAGMSVVQLNGEASGQTVFHIHFHIIPRHSGDGLAMKWSHETYRSGEIEEYQQRIVQALTPDPISPPASAGRE